MLKNLMQRYIDRADAASIKAAAEKTYVTTTDIVRVRPTRLEATKVVGDGSSPWLSLELTILASAGVAGDALEKIGVLTLRRDSSSTVLNRFNAAVPAELAAGEAAFAQTRDQLLQEILPASVLQSSSVGKQHRGALRRVVSAVGPWIGGAVLMIVYSLVMTSNRVPAQQQFAMTQPQVQFQAGQAQGLSAEALSAALPNGQMPSAWADIPVDQQQLMMQTLQRVQAGDPAAKADLAAMLAKLAKVTPVAQAGGQGASTAVAQAQQGLTPGRVSQYLTADEKKKLAGVAQIRLKTGGVPFYAFVDPMCPSCKDLEQQAQKVNAKYNMIAIPVGFKPGGKELAAAALCSKDPVASWHEVAMQRTIATKPCEDGLKKVEANNQLFLSMLFTATPTVAAPNGKLAVGSANPADIDAWLGENTAVVASSK